MLIRQPRHAFCGLFISLCFVQVSTLKVDQDSTFLYAASVKRYPQPTSHPVGLSLDKSGSKALSTQDTNSKSVATSQSLRDGLIKLDASKNRLRKATSGSSIIMISMLALWVAVAVCFLMAPGGEPLMSPRGPRSPRGDKVQPPNNPNTTASDPLFTTNSLKFTGGSSFASRYHEAKGQDRQALELLLRCSVISKEEFHSENVSQEHIEECIWVAKVMLLQKPLELWVALGQEDGQKSFKDTVAAINSARENARENASVEEPGYHYVPRPFPPDSPQFNDMGLSPGSLQKDCSAVSLGSSVSFGVEDPDRDPGAVSPQVSLPSPSPPPTILNASALHVPPTMPPAMPPLKTQNSMAEKSPIPVLNCFSQVEDAALPSSNEALNSMVPSGSSLNGGGGFLMVLTPSPSFTPLTGQPPASQETLPPPTAPSPAASAGSSPSKRFSFKAQEVMTNPPDPTPPSPDVGLRAPSSSASMSVAHRGLPQGTARRIQSQSDISSQFSLR